MGNWEQKAADAADEQLVVIGAIIGLKEAGDKLVNQIRAIVLVFKIREVILLKMSNKASNEKGW